ncbi:MAG TPA: aromatase/cyclase [Nakamurella sp.]|nr:aromatase/cyclase [Nakamurella sp.]
MHHEEHSVTVNAPIDVVWRVLLDVESYADIFPPTQRVDLLEEGDNYQIARLFVLVNGELNSWTSRRDIDADRQVIAYRQLETAPIVGSMGGEWRASAGPDGLTELVLTHDFEVRAAVDGKVAGRFEPAEADRLLCAAVERNSVADLDAVKQAAELAAERGAGSDAAASLAPAS